MDIVNPEAIGNPDETPIMRIPDGEAGEFMRAVVAANRRALLAQRCGQCNDRRGMHDGMHPEHAFVEKSITDNLADRKADIAAGLL